MGLYVWISEYERKNYLYVCDSELQTLFNETRELDPTLHIYEYVKKKFWRNKRFYNIYHSREDGAVIELRQILAGSGDKNKVTAYLYGLANGLLSSQRL